MRCISKSWSHYPALMYGFCALIGSCLAIYRPTASILLILAMLCSMLLFYIKTISHSLRIRMGMAAVLGGTAFLFANCYYTLPEVSDAGIPGLAQVKFTNVKKTKTPFGPIWAYQGILLSFSPQSQYGIEIARNVPVSFSFPVDGHTQRPTADKLYQVIGRLKKKGQGKYALSVSQSTSWEPLTNAGVLAEWRISAKESVKQHIHQAIRSPHTAAFLSGIATGEFDDRILAFELGRFGLQHIMAISGFHFAILTVMLGFLFRLVFSYRMAAGALLAVLSGYFVFLGPSASVTRSWIAIAIALSGLIFGKRSNGLNALGVAVLCIALWDPFLASSIGFQFSFAVTAAILIWHAPCNAWLQHLFATRRLSDIAEMGRLDQHGYCILYFLRQALALGIAVNLAALPLTLYHFHKFPLMSLLYNLFFPFMVSLSMLMLVAAFIAVPLPLLANFLHAVNERYTEFMLNFAFNMPSSLDWTIRVPDIPTEILALYLSMLFICGIAAKQSTLSEI